jgi:hypothetical protein
LSAIFQHAQLVATLVERLARLLHLGRDAAGLVSQRLQVGCWSRDVASNAPTGFARRLTNWNCQKKIENYGNEMRSEDEISIWEGRTEFFSVQRTDTSTEKTFEESFFGRLGHFTRHEHLAH